jgi:hypothetical protein
MCAYERKVGDGGRDSGNVTAKMKGSHTLGRGRKGKKEHSHTHKTTVEQGDPARLMAGALCEMARYRMDLHVAFIMNK